MNLVSWQATTQNDSTGAAIVSPILTVRIGGPSGDLADLYDSAGVGVDNPYTGGTDGFAQFFARPGTYWIQSNDSGTLSNGWYWEANQHFAFGWDAESIQSAADIVGEQGGGVVQLPDGVVNMTTDSVAANEGTCVTLTSAHHNVTFRGAGATQIITGSNEIECFLINGANDVEFKGIHFDNSSHGVLQDQVKVDTYSYTLGGGVAGYGNAANCAIRQVRGSGLTVEDCKFSAFNISVEYIGDIDDDQVLSGDMVSINCEYDGCVQGVIPHQPHRLFIDGVRAKGGIDSINFDTSRDPGHQAVYVTNRDGAAPKEVVISNVYDEDSSSSTIKIRKGESVSVVGYTGNDVGRGIELSRVQNGTVTGYSIVLKDNADDSNQCGLEAVDSGNVLFGDGVVDVSAADAWGARIRSDSDSETWHNDGVRTDGLVIVQDYSTANGKAPVLLSGQSNANIKFKHKQKGTTVGGRAPAHLIGSDKCRVEVTHECPDGVSDAYKLAELEADCTDCVVKVSDSDIDVDFVFGSGSTSTVYDLGTGTVVDYSGHVSGSWTPAIEFSGGNGTFVEGASVAIGEYSQFIDRIQFEMRIVFTPTIGTASGNLRVTLPETAKDSSSLSNYALNLGRVDNLLIPGDAIQVNPVAVTNSDFMQFSTLRSENGDGFLDVSALSETDGAGATQYLISVTGTYPT